MGGKLTWFVGGRGGIPLADVDTGNWQVANAYAGFAMALYDSYYWAPYLPISGTGGVEWHPIDMLWVRASGDPIFYFPLRSSRDFEFVWQNRFEGVFENDSGIGGGLAIQAVVWDSGLPGDDLQFSAEPFFSYDNDKFILRAGILLALDSPLGFGFRRGRVASPHVQIGGHF
jgi:hypothetical protein